MSRASGSSVGVSPGPNRGSVSSANGGSGQKVDIVHQAEKLNQCFGEIKGLRAQFTEFRKQILGGAEMKAMKEDMKVFRQEIAGARQAQAFVDQMRQAVEQNSAQQQQLRQQLEASAQATAGLQRQVQRIDREVEPLVQQLRVLRQDQAQMQQMQQVQQEQASLRQRSEEAMRHMQELSQKVQQFDAATGHATEAKREVERLRQEHAVIKQRSDEAERRVQESFRTVDQLKAESQRSLEQLRQEVSSVKNESNGAKGLQREQMAHMRMLDEKTRGMDDLHRLKATVDTTGSEFWSLKKQLYDAGVLAPPKIPEPEKVPVGTLELGEDCFTARLLIRLGLMKAQGDALQEALAEQSSVRELRGMDASDMFEVASDMSSEALVASCGLNENIEEDVTGLAVPEIEQGGHSRTVVTAGWIAICILTLGIQVLIVFIMMLYGIEAGDDCIKESLPPGKWYMLHVSKAAATLAAGMLMGKELMDIVNYWMVSELLETKTSIEVVVTGVLRIALILFIAMANVTIFMTMTSPADVWINMTALGFIGELSSAILDIGKKGVFGHDISKATTSINFSLNFMTDYPWWFNWARGFALIIAFAFIGFFAFLLFIMPDNICLEDGTSEAKDLMDRLLHMF